VDDFAAAKLSGAGRKPLENRHLRINHASKGKLRAVD
jgi:hypothetical protein